MSPPAADAMHTRAWLTPAGRPDTSIWSMFIEGDPAEAVHEGELALLVARAVRAGASGFFVWSPTERTYVRSSAADARAAE